MLKQIQNYIILEPSHWSPFQSVSHYSMNILEETMDLNRFTLSRGGKNNEIPQIINIMWRHFSVQHVKGKTVRPIFLSVNHDNYEAAADDLRVLNPNRFSNNFGAVGGILAGSGAIKFTIFS